MTDPRLRIAVTAWRTRKRLHTNILVKLTGTQSLLSQQPGVSWHTEAEIKLSAWDVKYAQPFFNQKKKKKLYSKAFIKWKKKYFAKCPDGYYLQQILELEITP